MHGNVFECYDEQTDRRQYAKTVEALMGYAKKNLKCAEDLKSLFATEMTNPTLERPVRPGADADETDIAIWNEDIRDYAKRKRVLRGNLAAIQAIIWGQCSEAMRSKLKSIDGYEESVADDDCEWMLKNIKAVTMQFDAKHNGYISMLDATAAFLNCRQQQGQTADSYLEALKSHADTIEYHGGTLVLNPNLVPATRDDGTPYNNEEERKKVARDCTLGAAFIRGSDPTRYGALVADLANQYNKGKDEYPKDITTSAYSMIVNYRAPTNATARNRNVEPTSSNHAPAPSVTSPESSAMTFAQRAPGTPGTNGVTHEGVTCYRCNNTGHYASDCPDETASTTGGTTLVQYGFMLAQGVSRIDPSWILLDSQSTISVFCNPDMLRNIRPSGHVLRAVTNGGSQESTLIADFPNLGEVWFNPESIANILSLADVRKVCRVTMDSSVETAIVVHRLDGSPMRFTEHKCGLYVYDSTNDSSSTVTAYTMVSTVAAQKRLFTRRDVANADAARQLYRLIGRPSEAEYQRILANGSLRNCSVTPLDAQRALTIYGPDIATLKGKTTRGKAAPRVAMFSAVPLPPHIMTHYRDIVLCIDFFLCKAIFFYIPFPGTLIFAP
jgi:Zinc knuckle